MIANKFSIVVITAALVLLAAIVGVTCTHNQAQQAQEQASRHLLGSPDAPIKIIEFGDFQCAYCANFHRQTLLPLKNTLIANGTVQFEYRHYPFLGPESDNAALATECAAQQDVFWEYHDHVYASTLAGNPLQQQLYDDIAEYLVPDMAAWQQCYQETPPEQLVEADKNYGRRLGVQGTPSLFINGQAYRGDYDYFTLIDHLENLPEATLPPSDNSG